MAKMPSENLVKQNFLVEKKEKEHLCLSFFLSFFATKKMHSPYASKRRIAKMKFFLNFIVEKWHF